MNTSKETERVNEEGEVEIKVDSVDYRSPPGGNQDQQRKENVQVTHVPVRTDDDKVGGGGGGGILAGAAAKVAETIQSAKENVFGKTQGTDNEKN